MKKNKKVFFEKTLDISPVLWYYILVGRRNVENVSEG